MNWLLLICFFTKAIAGTHLLRMSSHAATDLQLLIADTETDSGTTGSNASGPERTRGWVIEQLAGVCSLPAISESSVQSVVHYLATNAFLEVDASIVSCHALVPTFIRHATCRPPLVNIEQLFHSFVSLCSECTC